MTAHTASLINALVLIAVSLWGYFSSAAASMTALLPAAFGIALLICYPGVKSQNKIVAHIAALLTLVVFVALFMPLSGAFGRGDALAVTRLLIMEVFTLYALVFFVKSFIDARRRRA
ncbi:MAG: hypothetical protein AAFY02_21190 [Pseudomonadota bacterium]